MPAENDKSTNPDNLWPLLGLALVLLAWPVAGIALMVLFFE